MLENPIAKPISSWVPISGIWTHDADAITYVGPENSQQLVGTSAPLGISLSNVPFTNGKIKCSVTLPEEQTSRYGQVLLGFSSWQSRFISVGINGVGPAFVALDFVPGAGWRTLASAGSTANLVGHHPYEIEVGVNGQRMTLNVDGIKVLDHTFSGPLSHEQIGLYAAGQGPIRFSSVTAWPQAFSAFVVMQFGSPFDELYNDVIKQVCSEFNLEAFRADDISGPGIIVQDIIQSLTGSNLVIADVSKRNPNVFYEVGFSHALDKPTILLADRNEEYLPFDIRGNRVIFYDNTIGGKSGLEADLRRHLTSILGE